MSKANKKKEFAAFAIFDCIRFKKRFDNSYIATPNQLQCRLKKQLESELRLSQFPQITEIAFTFITRVDFIKGAEQMRTNLIEAANTEKDIRSSPLTTSILYECYPDLKEKDWAYYESKAASFPTFARLNREYLSSKPSFAQVWPNIREAIEDAPKPLCIVAHHGVEFDFPILMAELARCGLTEEKDWLEDVYFVDSLVAVKQMDKKEGARVGGLLRGADKENKACKGDNAALARLLFTRFPEDHPMRSDPSLLEESWTVAGVRRLFDKAFVQSSTGRWKYEQHLVGKRCRFKQVDIYREILSGSYNAHKADDDCAALLQICMAYSDTFLEYADTKAGKLAIPVKYRK